MTIVLSNLFKRQFRRLDAVVQKRVTKYLNEIAALENPRSRGKALTADFKGVWRYRVGDYRILCRIMDKELIITVIKIGHRCNVYEGDWND